MLAAGWQSSTAEEEFQEAVALLHFLLATQHNTWQSVFIFHCCTVGNEAALWFADEPSCNQSVYRGSRSCTSTVWGYCKSCTGTVLFRCVWWPCWYSPTAQWRLRMMSNPGTLPGSVEATLETTWNQHSTSKESSKYGTSVGLTQPWSLTHTQFQQPFFPCFLVTFWKWLLTYVLLSAIFFSLKAQTLSHIYKTFGYNFNEIILLKLLIYWNCFKKKQKQKTNSLNKLIHSL